MTRPRLWTIGLVLGFAGSLVGTLLVRTILHKLIWESMALEFLAGLLGIIAWQLWARHRHDVGVLVTELVGAVLGTGVAMRWGL